MKPTGKNMLGVFKGPATVVMGGDGVGGNPAKPDSHMIGRLSVYSKWQEETVGGRGA